MQRPAAFVLAQLAGRRIVTLAHRHRRTFAALTLRTDDGLTGISRTWGAEARAIHDLFAPALLAQDPRNVERIWSDLYARTVPYLGQERTLAVSRENEAALAGASPVR